MSIQADNNKVINAIVLNFDSFSEKVLLPMFHDIFICGRGITLELPVVNKPIGSKISKKQPKLKEKNPKQNKNNKETKWKHTKTAISKIVFFDSICRLKAS